MAREQREEELIVASDLQVINDIKSVTEASKRNADFNNFLWALSRMHGLTEGSAEALAAISMQASIIAFGRPGENSRDSALMTSVCRDALSDLRSRLATYPWNQIASEIARPSKAVQIAPAVATLYLSLDVAPRGAPPGYHRLLLLGAGLDTDTDDAQGDAQQAAEDHFLSPATPLFENEDTDSDPRRDYRNALRRRCIREFREAIAALTENPCENAGTNRAVAGA
ncbi:hypothetical protein PARHAE_03243 [Paracoccus haematequi]|uniref:Uncharacterized protein n=1 Tax=Paracoccus haematequi TaxID=2491866 RepID=A0A447IRB3_9RHOB|nr:hypothetical protein [Paracoccus haematequi]VDS10032.1 hypothetical protein PARHAE_03243 [Paracoccus haematequi]